MHEDKSLIYKTEAEPVIMHCLYVFILCIYIYCVYIVFILYLYCVYIVYILCLYCVYIYCIFISRGAEGPGREILQRPPSVRPSRLVFAL